VNYCYDCNSGYSKPGTCNCFAPGGKREPRVVSSTSPWVTPEVWPQAPYVPPPLPPVTITIPEGSPWVVRWQS
jgi:hypothetical protein